MKNGNSEYHCHGGQRAVAIGCIKQAFSAKMSLTGLFIKIFFLRASALPDRGRSITRMALISGNQRGSQRI
jgi:hypothetical protein